MIKQSKINELTDISKQIKKALKSKPKNEKLLVNILNSTTNSERQIIRTIYKRLYNKPIQNDIKSELNNNFKDFCISMFDTPYEYDSRELYKALNSVPINYKVIIEIFTSRNKSHLNIVIQAYEQFFKISLKEEILKKISNNFSNFLFIIMDTNRSNEKMVSYEDAYNYAKMIKELDINIFSNENIFKSLFVEKSREDLVLISRAFFELYKINLYKHLKNLNNKDSEENNKKLMKGILFFQISPSEWFCKKIKKAISGLKTDFNQLNRILIYRANIDIGDICKYYLLDKGNELYKDIRSLTDDSYGEALVNLCLQ